MELKKALMISAVASTFIATGSALADEHGTKSEAEKIHCEGVNACKGHGACRTEANACAGQNGCAGQGFMVMTPEECEQAKAEQNK